VATRDGFNPAPWGRRGFATGAGRSSQGQPWRNGAAPPSFRHPTQPRAYPSIPASSETLRHSRPVTVHESMVTSAQKRMEPRRYFSGASVDVTDARSPERVPGRRSKRPRRPNPMSSQHAIVVRGMADQLKHRARNRVAAWRTTGSQRANSSAFPGGFRSAILTGRVMSRSTREPGSHLTPP
jgi:hypothetical protein